MNPWGWILIGFLAGGAVRLCRRARRHHPRHVLWRSRMKTAEAQVQRVREMHTIDQCPRCAEFHCLECGCEGVYTEQVSCRTTRVLDGGESDE